MKKLDTNGSCPNTPGNNTCNATTTYMVRAEECQLNGHHFNAFIKMVTEKK